MPTCICNDCEDKRHTDVHLTTNTNTDILTTYSKLIKSGTVIRIDGQGFYYSNYNPFNDRLDGEWVGDKGDVISAKSSSITSCKETPNSCIPTYSHPPSTQKQSHNDRRPRTQAPRTPTHHKPRIQARIVSLYPTKEQTKWLPRTRHWLLADSGIQFNNKAEEGSYIKSLIDDV